MSKQDKNCFLILKLFQHPSDVHNVQMMLNGLKNKIGFASLFYSFLASIWRL